MSVSAHLRVKRRDFALDVSVDLADSCIVAVLGPNGAGKSTLVRALAGLQRIDEGRLLIDGDVVDDAGRTVVPAYQRSIGVVFQDYALFPHLSVLDNVAFGPRSRGDGRGASRQGAITMLDRLDIADLALRRPGEVSGGQAQRVALARALMTEPSLLLLDEPLAALDAQTRESVRLDLGRQLASFAGTTVLITHDPLDAMLLADRVLVLENGAIIQDGTPVDLAGQPVTTWRRCWASTCCAGKPTTAC